MRAIRNALTAELAAGVVLSVLTGLAAAWLSVYDLKAQVPQQAEQIKQLQQQKEELTKEVVALRITVAQLATIAEQLKEELRLLRTDLRNK